MGLLLMISDTDLNVDTITVEEGRRAAGAHKVLFSFLGIFFKGKEPKKGHNRQNSVRAPLPLMVLRLKFLF